VGSLRHGELLDGCVHARWRDNARRTGSVLEGVHHTFALVRFSISPGEGIQRMSMMNPIKELPIPEVMANILGFLHVSGRLKLASYSTTLQQRVYWRSTVL
jgi:hypothetical protein